MEWGPLVLYAGAFGPTSLQLLKFTDFSKNSRQIFARVVCMQCTTWCRQCACFTPITNCYQ